MPHAKRPFLALFAVALIVASFLGALVFAGPAAAGVYDSAVLADAPIGYWRLGEDDGATIAADSSGNGVTLTYTSTALLGEDAGIANEVNMSAAADSSTIASRGPVVLSSTPGMFETWIRTNVPDGQATVYYFQAGNGDRFTVTVGTDGFLHATIVRGGPCCQPTITMVGPSIGVSDGFWHYVTVDFANWFIYLDLAPGPKGTASGGFASPNVVGSASISLGGGYFYGQLDEAAVYASPLSTPRMSAHASAGGLGWDVTVPGGEEGSPPGCIESGVFHKGSPIQRNSPDVLDNYFATDVINYITTSFKKVPCGTAYALPPSPNLPDYPRPTFVSGQTVRVKTPDPTGMYQAENYYIEWGPIQYKCTFFTTCYGLFFNMKATDSFNDVCWIPFKQSQYNFVRLQGCPTPPAPAVTAINGCLGDGVGTHGWKLLHNASTQQWEAWFLCRTQDDNSTHDSSYWQRVFTHSDTLGPYRYLAGWPDMEAFVQGLKCSAAAIRNGTCWKREGEMNETHSTILYRDGGTLWKTEAYAVCRKDNSYRWDGKQVPATAPLSQWQVYQNANGELCVP